MQIAQSYAVRHQVGFTLIELVIFTLIVGVLGSTMWVGYQEIIQHSGEMSKTIKATQYAEGRLELLLQQKRHYGYAVFTDPCDTNPTFGVCAVSVRLVPSSLPLQSSTTETTITVQGIGPDNTRVNLSMLIGNDG